MFTQNPLRPKSGHTLRVWEIADRITTETGRKALRRQVLPVAVAQGILERTASKQYNDWRNAYERAQEADGVSEMPAMPFQLQLEIKPDGRVLIPAEIRILMKLGDHGRVNAEVIDGELRLFSPAIALEKLQRYIRENDQGTGSVVDQLINERRTEAAQE